MEDVKKRTPGYAESQIRVLLAELNKADGSHSAKVVAVKKFSDYISKYKPELYDDDVDYLFRGAAVDGGAPTGLLYWSGASSSKHDGQLKRICGPVITLLRSLVALEFENSDNIFYERFVHCPVADLLTVNFETHIEAIASKKSSATSSSSMLRTAKLAGAASSRIGGAEDALELIGVLVSDHRTPDGDNDPVDLEELLNNNVSCLERAKQYLQRNKSDYVVKSAGKARQVAASIVEIRPTCWKDVQVRTVPWQEGEDGEVETLDVRDPNEPIPDPLGVSDVDLRAAQSIYHNSQAEKTRNRAASVYRRRNQSVSATSREARKMSQMLLPVDGALSSAEKAEIRRNRRAVLKYDDEDDEDESDHEGGGDEGPSGSGAKVTASVLPADKAFSPGLFLSVVHSNITFEKLEASLTYLSQLLLKQSSQRENLVRQHFGLFINCADDLEWLKAFRLGTHQVLELRRPRKASIAMSPSASAKRSSVSSSPSSNTGTSESGEIRLERASKSLNRAKSEAQATLAPILDRMRKGRRIRSTEQVLKRLASTLEYPHKMNAALQNDQLEEVVAIYKRIASIPATSSLKILNRVKQNADSVVGSLKEKCINTMMSPDPNFASIVRHSKVLQELFPDVSVYIPYLRKSFEVQLKNFRDSVDQLLVRFVDEIDDCQNRILNNDAPVSVPANVITKSSPLMSSVLHKHGGAPSGARRSQNGSVNGSIAMRRPSGGSRLDDDVSISHAGSGNASPSKRSAFSRSGAGAGSSGDVLEELLFGKGFGQDTINSAYPLISGRTRRNSLSVDTSEDTSNLNAHGAISEYVDLDTDVDFPVVDGEYAEEDGNLQSLMEVRFHHLNRLIDCIDTWLPTLHRLIAELTRLGSGAATLNVRSSIIGMQRDVGLSPARRFCEQLTYCCDRIREAMCGVSISSSATRPSGGGGNQGLATASKSKDGKGGNAAVGLEALLAPEQLTQSWYANPLPSPLYSGGLSSVAELYEAVCSVVQSRDQIYTLTPPPSGVASNTSRDRAASAAPTYNILQREIDQQIRLYLGAINDLCEFAKENERQQAEQILSRVHEICTELWPSSLHSSESRPVAFAKQQAINRLRSLYTPSSSGQPRHSGGSGEAGASIVANEKGSVNKRANPLYCSTKTIETVILRALEMLSTRTRRTEWTQQTVRSAIHKNMVSIVDSLRREALFLDAEVTNAISSSLDNMRNVSDARRASAFSPRRASAMNSGRSLLLELEVLDDELKGIGVSASANRNLQAARSSTLFNIVIACVELRTRTFPRIWRAVSTLFPLSSEADSIATGNISSPFQSAGVSGSNSSASGAIATASNPGPLPNESKPAGLSALLKFGFAAAVDVEDAPTTIANLTKMIDSSAMNAGESSKSKEKDKEADALHLSLKERLDRSATDTVNSIPGAILSVMSESIDFENFTAERFIRQRLDILRNSILCGYSVIVKTERARLAAPTSTGTNSKRASIGPSVQRVGAPFVIGLNATLSKHLFRILLLLSSEKVALNDAFGRMSIDAGFPPAPSGQSKKPAAPASPSRAGPSSTSILTPGSSQRLRNVLGHATTRSGPLDSSKQAEQDDKPNDDDDELDVEFGDFRELSDALLSGDDYGAYGSANNKRISMSKVVLYKDFLFAEICRGLLNCYLDIMSNLLSNSFCVSSTSASSIPPSISSTSGAAGAVVKQSRRNSGTANSASTAANGSTAAACTTPLTLGLAYEEFLALKSLCKLVLPPLYHNGINKIAIPAEVQSHSGAGTLFASQLQILQDPNAIQFTFCVD